MKFLSWYLHSDVEKIRLFIYLVFLFPVHCLLSVNRMKMTSTLSDFSIAVPVTQVVKWNYGCKTETFVLLDWSRYSFNKTWYTNSILVIVSWVNNQ